VKADLRRDSGGGPEESLRSILRRWEAPSPPPELERDLRSALRARRPGRPVAGWLALAAALALLALWPLAWREPATAPARPVARVSVPPPVAAVGSTAPREPAEASRASKARRVAGPRRRALQADAGRVIVEPRQVELLVRFGEHLQHRRSSASVFSSAPVTRVSSEPMTVVPAGAPEPPTLAAGLAEVPRYRGDWERVSGVWPPVQLSAPIMGR